MFPEITTGSFLLRNIVSTDQAKIFEGLSHPEVIRYYGVSYDSFDATAAQMEFYDKLLTQETGIWWAICYRDNPQQLIGACGFNDLNKVHHHVEVGYWLLPAYHGRGIMRECLPTILAYGFNTLAVHRIVAVVETGNSNSSRLLEKCGFTFEGTHRECEFKNGAYISLHYYALINNA